MHRGGRRLLREAAGGLCSRAALHGRLELEPASQQTKTAVGSGALHARIGRGCDTRVTGNGQHISRDYPQLHVWLHSMSLPEADCFDTAYACCIMRCQIAAPVQASQRLFQTATGFSLRWGKRRRSSVTGEQRAGTVQDGQRSGTGRSTASRGVAAVDDAKVQLVLLDGAHDENWAGSASLSI